MGGRGLKWMIHKVINYLMYFTDTVLFSIDVFKADFKRFRRLNDGDMKNEVIDFAKPDIFQEAS